MNGYLCNQKEFWIKLFTKIFGDFASLSVWGFMIVFSVASWLCHGSHIDGTAWGIVVSIGFGEFLTYRHVDKKRSDSNGKH